MKADSSETRGGKEKESRPPEKLAKLIELIELLPADASLTPLNRVRSDNAHNYSDYNRTSLINRNKTPFEVWTYDARWELADKLKELPDRIRQYIYKDSIYDTSVPDLLEIENHPLDNGSMLQTESSKFDLNAEMIVHTGGELFPLEIEVEELASELWNFIFSENWHPVLIEMWILIFIDARKQLFFEIWGSTRKAVENYENFCQLREQFNLIADFALRLPSTMQRLNEIEETVIIKKVKDQIKDNLFLDYKDKIQFPFFGYMRLVVDSQGIMGSEPTELVEATLFDSGKIDIRRIRKCLNCGRIFWAKQFGRFYCETKCGNYLRKFLEEETEEKRTKKAEAKRIRELHKKVGKLTEKYKNKRYELPESTFFDSLTVGSFKLAKGTKTTIIGFELNKKSKTYPIRCNIETKDGEVGFFTLPHDKKPFYHIKLKLGSNSQKSDANADR